MALTTYERLRGALAGVGNAGDRILKHVADLQDFVKHVPEGPKRRMVEILLQSIAAQAEELKTVE